MTTPLAPVSPLHGVLETQGTLSCNGLVHLLNPVGSGRTLFVWEARIQGDLFISDPPHRMRITNSPGVQAGGTRKTAAETYLDERDLRTPAGIFEAFDLWNTPFDDTFAEWAAVTGMTYDENLVTRWADRVIVLPEGWALEFETPSTSGSNERVYLVWDDLGPDEGTAT